MDSDLDVTFKRQFGTAFARAVPKKLAQMTD